MFVPGNSTPQVAPRNSNPSVRVGDRMLTIADKEERTVEVNPVRAARKETSRGDT